MTPADEFRHLARNPVFQAWSHAGAEERAEFVAVLAALYQPLVCHTLIRIHKCPRKEPRPCTSPS